MRSKAILDMKLPYHEGLSFRFFEAIYYKKKIFGGIYDDRFLVKPVPAAIARPRRNAVTR